MAADTKFEIALSFKQPDGKYTVVAIPAQDVPEVIKSLKLLHEDYEDVKQDDFGGKPVVRITDVLKTGVKIEEAEG